MLEILVIPIIDIQTIEELKERLEEMILKQI